MKFSENHKDFTDDEDFSNVDNVKFLEEVYVLIKSLDKVEMDFIRRSDQLKK